MDMNQCPCGSQKNFSECCGEFIRGLKIPNTPEQLMRSRYSAYTQANIDYIIDTMRGKAASGFNAAEAQSWAQSVIWLKLEVLNYFNQDENIGFVEFRAHYQFQGKQQILHELSEFHRIDGRWYYTDGQTPKNQPQAITKIKTGRNDPCHCGSKLKYKKCCGK